MESVDTHLVMSVIPCVVLRRTVLRVQVTVQPTFQWRDGSHGNSMQWHIWVEDSENEHVYHSETWMLTKKMMREPEHRLAFTIPIFEPLPSQYYIRCRTFPHCSFLHVSLQIITRFHIRCTPACLSKTRCRKSC